MRKWNDQPQITPRPRSSFPFNKGFHVGDARVKKLTPASIRSIGRHVEF